MSDNKAALDLACVDVFCGVGGLTHGLIRQGIPVLAGIDLDETCRHPFEANNKARFVAQDVSTVSIKDLRKLFGGARTKVLAGCAPCQPFSSYAHRYRDKENPQWALLYEFSRLVAGMKPDIVTVENVPAITKHKVFKDFLGTLRALGYKDPWFDTIDCADYGLPQSRQRLVLLASLRGPIELIKPTHRHAVTVRQAIGNLPRIEAGGNYSRDPLHTAATLSELNIERIRASRPGGTWREWPKRLVADCHRRGTGHSYPGVYGRMSWNAPAPTLTTQFYGFGSGRFGHPEQDRAISLREGAILQGFPKSYSFIPDGKRIHFTTLGRMIGNAVPVMLGRAIGRSIKRHIGV